MKSGVLAKYKDFLPITPKTPLFSLGEGDTPLVRCDKLEKKIRDKVQVLVVCSRNKKLHKQMEKIAGSLETDAKIFGFVDDLYKMMAVNDVIISKSGGLTTSESLASGLPMIIISPIPGQETKNCDLLVKNGAAIRINKPFQIKGVVEGLFARPGALDVMHHQALMLARPNSADYIAALACRLLKIEG